MRETLFFFKKWENLSILREIQEQLLLTKKKNHWPWTKTNKNLWLKVTTIQIVYILAHKLDKVFECF